MTSGTQTKGALSPCISQDWLSGQIIDTGGSVGSRIVKSWSGGDSFPSRKSSRVPKAPLSFANLASLHRRKGIVDGPIEEVFYDGTFAKSRKGLNPNVWTCTYTEDHFPEGRALFRREIVSTGQIYDYYGWLRTTWDGLYQTPLPSLPVLTPSDEYKIISRLSSQIRGNSFNAAVAGSQSLQVVNLFGETASRIATTIRSVKKGKLVDAWDNLVRGRKAKLNRQKMSDIRKELRVREYLKKLPNGDILDRRKAVPKWLRRSDNQDLLTKIRLDKSRNLDNSLDSISSDWLALQYGWLPLLSDMFGALELYAHQQERSFYKSYRASYTRRLNFSGTYGSMGVSDNYSGFAEAKSSISKRVIVTIEAKPSTSSILGLQNPLSIAWELTPWSFVLDWILPVGDYLQATADVRMLNVKGVVTTIVEKQSLAGPYFKTHVNGGLRVVPFQQSLSGMRKNLTSYKRTLGASLPTVPLPTFKPLSQAFSFIRAGNAAALLRSIKR